MLHLSILTLFPEMFSSVFAQSIIKRALDTKKAAIEYINIRDFAEDTYKSVDDHPYGGGHGMILRVDIIDRALTSVKTRYPTLSSTSILLDPRGTTYSQHIAERFSSIKHLIILCGHYEGVDARIRTLVDEEISVGDYILTGGEIPAMMIVDSVVRLLPSTLKNPQATIDESFSSGLLEYPQYTRPETFNDQKVPPVLLSGNHEEIRKWQSNQSLEQTKMKRPDLLQKNILRSK